MSSRSSTVQATTSRPRPWASVSRGAVRSRKSGDQTRLPAAWTSRGTEPPTAEGSSPASQALGPGLSASTVSSSGCCVVRHAVRMSAALSRTRRTTRQSKDWIVERAARPASRTTRTTASVIAWGEAVSAGRSGLVLISRLNRTSRLPALRASAKISASFGIRAPSPGICFGKATAAALAGRRRPTS